MYQNFLQEWMEEAEQEMDQWIRAYQEDGAKPKPYKENYYFRDHLQIPKIHPALANENNRERIIEYVGKFLDDHAAQLGTAGPVYSFTYTTEDAKMLFEMFQVTPDEIVTMYHEMVQETWDGKISAFFTEWATNSPHKILITSMLIDALQNQYDDIVECCEYLWAFSDYALVYRTFWKTGVKEETMKYTIERLNTKYKVKRVMNLQELLKMDAHVSVTAMESRLMTGMDHTYTDFMQRMRNQLKNTFKNISRAYYQNNENNASQHGTTTTFDDGSMADQEGHTTNIAQIVDQTVNKFGLNGLNMSRVRMAADASKVDPGNLTGYLNQVMGVRANRLPRLIENIITIYLTKNPSATTVGDVPFLNFGLALYRSMGSSKDSLISEMNEILNFWMYEIINIRSQYKSEGTIINYRRAVFNYIILMIQYYN